MRRIKLVVSDFHLGTGRSAPDGSVNNLEDFISDEAFIDMLEFYRTGEYADAEVELILNGDIFECLAVDPFLEGADMITEPKSLARLDAILDGHPEMARALRTFADDPARRVVFIVGNHDQDLLWEGVQKRIRERIHPSVRFIHGPYRFDGIQVEHGNQHEVQNRIDPHKMFLTKGLPEPILNLPWGSDLFINLLMRLKQRRPYINRVRPFRLAVWWSLLHDLRTLLAGIWYFLVVMLKARFRKQVQRRITFVKTLRVLFGFSAWPTLEDAARRILAQDGVHTVIFGHTHIPLTRHPVPGKTYINSGTWIPNSNLHIAGLGWNLMQTYVYIEYESERPRARLKLWHGRRMVEEDIIL